MCVAYHISSSPSLHPGIVKPSVAEEKLIRHGDSALVFFSAGDSVEMRWGFRTPFDSALHQVRADALSHGMWAEAFRNRRCVIPMSSFFTDIQPRNEEICHHIQRADGQILLVAGLWENSLGGGRTFSIITIQSSCEPRRLPALLEHETALAFLAGDLNEFATFAGNLSITETANPLRKSPSEAGRF